MSLPIIFQKTFLLKNTPHRHVESRFDISPESLRQKVKKFLVKVWKVWQNFSTFFQKKIQFSSKCFFGQVKCSFHNPVEKVSTKNTEALRSMFKNIAKIIFRSGKVFSSKRSNGQVDCSFEDPVKKKFGQKAGNFLFYGKKWYKTIFLRLLVDQRNSIDG